MPLTLATINYVATSTTRCLDLSHHSKSDNSHRYDSHCYGVNLLPHEIVIFFYQNISFKVAKMNINQLHTIFSIFKVVVLSWELGDLDLHHLDLHLTECVTHDKSRTL